MSSSVIPGTLRGYRSWYQQPAPAGRAPFELAPARGSYGGQMRAWQGIRAHAECFKPNLTTPGRVGHVHADPAPVFDCSCGVYARYFDLSENGYSRLPVLGSVQASGRIILMERGFRAEYATVEAICMPESGAWASAHRHFFRGTLREFARYHEIAYFDTFGELQEEFPPQDVSHLINPRLG